MDTNIVFSSADKNGDGYLDKSEWKGRDKRGTTPQPQSMPDSSTNSTAPDSATAPASTDPQPDTETPRQ
jgi:hypothetical protein